MILLHSVESQSSFEFIKQLEGCRKGQSVNGLHKMKQYLKQFGYIKMREYDDQFDPLLESAIRNYQQNYNLNVTGTLHPDTVNQMMMPRCGVKDVANTTTTNSGSSGLQFHHVSRYKFFPGNPKWPPERHHLTYNFKSSANVPGSNQDISAVCSRAFKTWSEVTNFTFEEVGENAKADIVIGFHHGDHGDGLPFDGPKGVVAHAFTAVDGRIHYDADEKWSLLKDPARDEMDLETIAVHEVGHVIGLDHSSEKESVMFATIGFGTIKREIAFR
ncbi:hypothetical protein Patl1_05974 [Pistacia atlantica]|uniref:Uncharacterized protein n=1 Tax=Pistacia atlantica TaxID=434234 RepID=A0ACC1BTQ5_9ROSI|nr:hypothetical protein Patl1_05974 [Pistacia atlantica]